MHYAMLEKNTALDAAHFRSHVCDHNTQKASLKYIKTTRFFIPDHSCHDRGRKAPF